MISSTTLYRSSWVWPSTISQAMYSWNIPLTVVPSNQLKSGLVSRWWVFWTRHLQQHCSSFLHIQCRNQKIELCLPIFVVVHSSPATLGNISDYCDLYGRQTWHLPDTVGTWLVHVRWPTFFVIDGIQAFCWCKLLALIGDGVSILH